MRALLCALLFALFANVAAADEVETKILETYKQFAEAQNARDLQRARSYLVDGSDFLWVSDGKTFWGRDVAIARMGGFQTNEVWHAEADLPAARVVKLTGETALLHMPLILALGSNPSPSRIPFLVSILFVLRNAEWKIAALLTTDERKPG